MGNSCRYYGRREALKIAIAGVAALCAPTVLLGGQSGKRRDLLVPWPGYDSFAFGDLEVTSIFDGGLEIDVAAEYFALDQSPADIESLLASRFLPPNKTIENIVPTIVSNGSDVILFETGLGSLGEGRGAGQLLGRMKNSGYDPEDVTIVALSHLHEENIGGLLKDGKPTFANARYFVGDKEYEFWTEYASHSEVTAQHGELVKATLAPLKEKMTMLRGGSEIASGIIAVEAFGHTPGHLMFKVTSNDKALLLGGDVATHYVVSFERPNWHSSVDLDQAAAAVTRSAVLKAAASDRTPMIGFHLPFPPVGFVERNGDNFRWAPETYQLSL